MFSQSHEIPLRERTESNCTYTEVLAYLGDGKVYQSNPSEAKPQAAQKGNVCWYYALNRIRIRYGKDSRPNANRHVEKIISEYRKSLTQVDLFKSISTTALNHISNVFEVKKDEMIFGSLEKSLMKTTLLGEKEEKIKIIRTLQKFSDLFPLAHTATAENKSEEIGPKLIDIILEDIPDADEIRNRLKNNAPKLSFVERITTYAQLMSDASSKNSLINSKISIMILAMVDTMVKLMKKNVDALKADDVIELHANLMRVSALYNLYKKLDLKADEAALKKLLTTGVYNVKMVSMAEKMAAEITKQINTETFPDSGKYISKYEIEALNAIYGYGHIIAYSRIIELYDLQISPWTPKHGFQGLTDAINKEGALVICGMAIGTPSYNSTPQVLEEEKGDPAKFGSRTIKFWPNKADLKPVTNDTSDQGHAIIVIGTQSIKNADGDNQEYVFFLDPNDASIPGEERTVYRVNYSELAPRLMSHAGIRLTDPNMCPEDGMYAVSARK